GLVFLISLACKDASNSYDEVKIPQFDFVKNLVFKQKLSAYNIFEGNAADLIPAQDYHLVELSSTLFTDYAHKQRLIKVPPGAKISRLNDGSMDYPDGTILTKTFFYQKDERDTSLGKRIIETRLEIKENGKWNIATYLWNEAQTDASLSLDGFDTPVNWINAAGIDKSSFYHVPSQNECMTCHQSYSKINPIGPSLRNLNRLVERNGTVLNQLSHLQTEGVLNDFDIAQVSQIVDYKDTSVSLSERARAYLEMNCAHCHNPSGWDKANQRQFDFRYEIPLEETGMLYKKEKISRTMLNGRMPFIGTTLLDEDGISLITDYLKSL
ncbi:MAG: hypothetical protein AAFR87_17515, partial [Bacteroidota bacterium]